MLKTILDNKEDYQPGLSIDCVIFGFHDNQLKVLLIKTKYSDKWALPVGFVSVNEDIDEAAVNVLFGDYNPSGKLPMSFPREEGQIPIYYNHFNTGRPAPNETAFNYVSAYTDLKNSPRFPFGYGLSYTTFEYSDLKLSKNKIKNTEIITV